MPGFEPGTSCTPSRRASQAALHPDWPWYGCVPSLMAGRSATLAFRGAPPPGGLGRRGGRAVAPRVTRLLGEHVVAARVTRLVGHQRAARVSRLLAEHLQD